MGTIINFEAPWTAEEINNLTNNIRTEALIKLENDGGIQSACFIFASMHPETEEPAKGVILMPMNFVGDESKAMSSEYIRLIAHASEAVALAFISESWVISSSSKEDSNKWIGKLDQHPDRKEIILFSFESYRFGNKIWFADIMRDVNNKPSATTWEDKTITNAAGRFLNLLPKVN